VNSPVIGYHGCDLKVASDVVTRKAKLTPGMGRYDWLGTGVYFWEDDPNLVIPQPSPPDGQARTRLPRSGVPDHLLRQKERKSFATSNAPC